MSHKISSLLQYRFVKRTSEPDLTTDVSADCEQNSHIQNGLAISEDRDSTKSPTIISETSLSSTQSQILLENSPGPLLSSQTTLSPIFHSSKYKSLNLNNNNNNNMATDSDEFESQNSWLSKKKGIKNGVDKTKVKKQRRIIRPQSSSDSESEDDRTNNGTLTDSQSTIIITSSSNSEDLTTLKQMFPTLSDDRLLSVLNNNGNDVQQAVNELIYPAIPGSNSKRKGSDLENDEPAKKKIRPEESTSNTSNGVNSKTDQDLLFLYESFPNHSAEVVKKTYEENGRTVETSMKVLKRKDSLKSNSVKMQKKVKKMKMKDVDFSDEDGDYSGEDYNSDDSMDPENIAQHADTILKFFQEAKIEELATIQGCSRKKAEIVAKLRPFNSYDDLVAKITSTKTLTYFIIPGCLEVIHLQYVVTSLMEKCERIGQEMESVVSALTSSECLEDSEDNITKQPSLLVSSKTLKNYQMIGLNWLRVMHAQHLNGILADEMGLGKTIQTIAFLAHLIEVGERGPHVIIVPSSTIENWLREMQDWCPSLKIVIYYGSQDERRVVRQQVLYSDTVEYNVILTTYNMATGSVEDRSLFKKMEFQYAVFDEGHMLKNMSSLRFQNLMRIRAGRRLLLTGTPLQNNLVELMSLLCFVMPDIFSGKTESLKKIFTMMTKVADEQGKFEKEKIEQAKRIMKPFVLRRLKQDVLSQMPAKEENVNYCEMIPAQQDIYDFLIQTFNAEIEKKKEYLSKGGGASMFMQLRKAANHPLLIRSIYDDKKLAAIAKDLCKEPSHRDRGALPKLIQEDLAVMHDFEINNVCKHYKSHIGKYMLDPKVINESGKFKALTKMLAKMKENDDRVLLFSQFVMVLDIVEVFLKDLGYKFFRLDGSTPVPERQKLIDDFNNDKNIFIFLLSTKAGGLGINLTAANTVIIHDIDFNPYNDKQAEDRCHRMGQTRKVKIHRLISKGTVEEGMIRVAKQKLKLEKDVTTSNQDEEENSSDVLSLLQEALQRKTQLSTEKNGSS